MKDNRIIKCRKGSVLSCLTVVLLSVVYNAMPILFYILEGPGAWAVLILLFMIAAFLWFVYFRSAAGAVYKHFLFIGLTAVLCFVIRFVLIKWLPKEAIEMGGEFAGALILSVCIVLIIASVITGYYVEYLVRMFGKK